MKKNATRYCAGPAYYSMPQTFTVQNKPAAVAPKETITHHFSVSNGAAKTSMQPKFVGGAENVKRNRNPANIRKWIARFYYF